MGLIDRFLEKHDLRKDRISLLSIIIAFLLFLPSFFGINYASLSSSYESLSVHDEITLWGFIIVISIFVSMVWTYFMILSIKDTSNLKPSDIDTSNLKPSDIDTSNLKPSDIDTSISTPSTPTTSTPNPTPHNLKQP